MTLREFLLRCKKIIDENPDALNMEMFTMHGASGAIDPMSNPFAEKISEMSDGELIKEMLPRDYPLDSIIWVYIGN